MIAIQLRAKMNTQMNNVKKLAMPAKIIAQAGQEHRERKEGLEKKSEEFDGKFFTNLS